jgi:hypothetical protein
MMWRNVFGHAIFQIIILTTVLFSAQGRLCEDYSVKCFSIDPTDSTNCLSYNPFFAENLYYRQSDLDKFENYTASDFDQDLLSKLRCSEFKRTSTEVVEGECTSAQLATQASFLPSMIEIGAETQKIRHFTIVF